jgi:hypothetical protein
MKAAFEKNKMPQVVLVPLLAASERWQPTTRFPNVLRVAQLLLFTLSGESLKSPDPNWPWERWYSGSGGYFCFE